MRESPDVNIKNMHNDSGAFEEATDRETLLETAEILALEISIALGGAREELHWALDLERDGAGERDGFEARLERAHERVADLEARYDTVLQYIGIERGME